MQYLRVNTVLWISASFQRRSHAVQYSCSQLPYNFPPEIKSTTNFVTGNIAQVFDICKSPLQGTKYRTITLQVDRQGQPIRINLSREVRQEARPSVGARVVDEGLGGP